MKRVTVAITLDDEWHISSSSLKKVKHEMMNKALVAAREEGASVVQIEGKVGHVRKTK